MLTHALKEWSIICRALADGRQAIILRKGGTEDAGEFRLVHKTFWLYPTYVHQQRQGIKPEALQLLEEVEAAKPPPGIVRLSHFAEVTGVYHVHDLAPALVLDHLHLWSEETVRKRFAYRTPGLYVLPVRVYRASAVHEIPETAAYQGCRSWVDFDRALPTDGAAPVLSDAAMEDVHRSLDLLLNPRAFA